MAIVQFKKGDEYLAKIEKIARGSKEQIVGPAIYDAADIVTDAVREKLSGVPTDERWAPLGTVKAGPRKAELAGLQNSLGIASLQDDSGFINVKVGFDGYNSIKTATWPNGQPNQLIARSVERGTYFMQANPFMKRAMASARTKALEAMKKKIDENLEKMMKG